MTASAFSVPGTPYHVLLEESGWYLYRKAARSFIVAGPFSSRALAEAEVEKHGYSMKATA